MSGTNVMLYRSTDTGAPTLSGTAGAVIALLDACLKDGYQLKTVTIARSGTTATATCATAHGYAADGLTKINISGASQSGYNGDFQITNVTTNTFDFTVTGSPATPATGTISAKVAPIGWGKPFSGTNKAVYRGAETAGTRLYLRVDDTGTTSARAIGYEAMTDVDTGTGLFPTTAQVSGGLYISKSATANATVRPWVLVGDGYEFHFFQATAVSYPGGYQQFHFGDPCSEMASDPYGCLIYGSTSAQIDNSPEIGSTTYYLLSSSGVAGQSGHYYARGYNQIGSSVGAGKLGNTALGTNNIGAGSMTYPAPTNNGLYVAPIYATDGLVLRAQLKALWQPLHTRPLGHLGFIAANISPISRRLLAVTTGYSSSTYGETHIDLDGPWR